MSTDNNKNKQIGDKELKAMVLKYAGAKYKDIAERIGVEYQTVRSWFMTGGKLRSFYFDYVEEENEQRRDLCRSMFKKSTEKAIRTIVGLLDDENPQIRLRAAKEIIDADLKDKDGRLSKGKFEIDPLEKFMGA